MVLTRQPDDQPLVAPAPSAEIGTPEQQPAANASLIPDQPDYGEDIDLAYWLDCMSDAERAEADWRKRGRSVVQIYRNAEAAGKAVKDPSKGTTFNILYANTEVLLGVVYQNPPTPVVRSRFTSAKAIPILPQPVMGPAMATPPVAQAGLQPTGPGLPLPAGASGPPLPPGGPVVTAGLPETALPGPPTEPNLPSGGSPTLQAAPVGPNLAALPGLGPATVEPSPASMVGQPGGLPSLVPPAAPQQRDIETAASVIEKALKIVVDDEHSHEAIKTAIKDVLLPGRGVCRARWKPQMKTEQMPGGPLPDGTMPTTERKIWEEVDDEYVYWEDVLFDPVRQAADCDWIGYRHLFSKAALVQEFAGNPKFDAMVASGRVEDFLIWTDAAAAKHTVGGGSAMKSAGKLGNRRKKAMVWEVWDRITRKIIWLIRDGGGLVLRVDPDAMQLEGFYPSPVPMLAVTTSDSRIPTPFYDLYAKLADQLDTLSDRISRLEDKIKVRGAYNSQSRDIADLLRADDGKMLPVAGVDMLNGGLANHIWLLPIAEWMTALQQLYLARDQIKNAIYEIMGISDIMRGATKATETATAQRIKGSMGVSRSEDVKGMASNFCRDLLRLKADIICKNFDQETLQLMTGEDITPEVMAIIRSDFMRTCTVDIETDSTVVPDEAAEQEAMSMTMTAVGTIMGGAQQMLNTGLVPPPMVIQLALELIKMALHPIRYSRGVIELIDGYQQQLETIIATGAQLGPPPQLPMLPPAGSPQARQHGGGKAGAPNLPPGGGQPPRGNAPAGPPNGATAPPIAGMPSMPQLAM